MRHLLALAATAALLSGCGLVGDSSGSKAAAAGARQPWEKPVRRASCGATDKVETGLQGQVPLQDRVSGRSQQGYNCNLEIVGQWQGDGASWQTAWYEDCAYYGTRGDTTRPDYGVVVVDASQKSNPRPAGYLQTTPMVDPWESLKVHEQRKLLGAVDGLGGSGGPDFDVYDISGDCRQPKLLFTGPMGDVGGHEGNWAQTGMTYWGASTSTYRAFDTTDPAHPVFMLNWAPPSNSNHGLSTNEDGSRLYAVSLGLAAGAPGNPAGSSNGLVIADVSDIEHRKPGGEVKLVSEMYWTDGSETAQHTIPVHIGGKPYIVFVDEAGVSGKACNGTQSPFAFARIIDIADEKNPKLAGKLMLDTHYPQNCPVVMADYSNGQFLFGYDSHYCGVDDPQETTAVACGYFNSGIRVFDVRDPYYPREIAYFNPPAQFGKAAQLQGSQHATGNGTADNDAALTADWCSAQVRFRKTADGGGELWTTCQDNGFMILKFTNGVWPFRDGM
ncbi:MAG TPA: hypothetical protein VM369_09305 [Candidatus Binatia bacterium]|nr:hypothetical protein [Candidatus Binatia bacterium]